MLVDLNDLTGSERFEADVCIAGAGAAGITLARALAARGRSVLLLESGGPAYEQPTQELYVGTETGTLLDERNHYLAATRLRYLGGTTNHWNGWCRPLENNTFKLRPWVADVGWPFDREALEPYYRQAVGEVELSPFDYDDATASEQLRIDDVVETVFFHISPPTRYALRYREELERSEKIQLLLHANLTRLDTDGQARTVRRAVARPIGGPEFTLKARHFVLATGAIENARILLANDRVQSGGLGNDHDLVGRYFMDHLHARVGRITFPYWQRAVPRAYDPVFIRGRENIARGVLRITDHEQESRQLPNGLVVLDRMTIPETRRLELAPDIARFAIDQLRLGRKPPANRGDSYFGWVTVHGEQKPNPDCRVTLGDEVDELGMRRSHLAWQLRDEDVLNLLKTARLVAERLGANGRGRMMLFTTEEDLLERTQWSFHHMGTTRMHEDPKRGVVDPDCKVHGVDNLYIAGSSVFPTSGTSNPTLTLLALALRMADHLA